MNWKQAMEDPQKEAVLKGAETEHKKFLKYGVFKAVDETEALPKEVIDTTVAVKPKTDGEMRVRVVGRGFRQTPDIQYKENDVSAPVVCMMTIRIIMVLMCMCNWYSYLIDVEGAFLNATFDNGERIFVEVPEPFRKWYPSYVLLMLQKTMYGTIQAAVQFWKMACRAMGHAKYERSKADPCLFFNWKGGSLSVMMMWVDDCLIAGPKAKVIHAKDKMLSMFDCKDLGEMKEYVGCRVERGEGWLRLTQPTQLKKFSDEFDLNTHRAEPRTPAEPNSVLNEGDQGEPLSEAQQSDYRKGTGILLHMMRWSRPEVLNSVRELSRHLKDGTKKHYKAMIRIMKYCVSKPRRGVYLKPKRTWDGKSKMEMRISGMSDSEYMKDPSRHSVNGWICFLEGCPINCASKMMPIIALSVTEAELYAAIQCVQDMLFAWRVLISMGMLVELPMILEVDNKGAVDLCNNWSVGGRTRHIEVKQYFLRELKEQGMVNVVWTKGDDMTADIFTKNLSGPTFNKHAEALVGNDEYMQTGKDDIEINQFAASNEHSKVANKKTESPIERENRSEYNRIWKEIVCE